MPVQPIPPEGRGDFETHSVGRVEAATVSQRYKRARTAIALESFSQSIRFQDTAVAAWTRVTLIQSYYLLSDELGSVVGRIGIEHISSLSVRDMPGPSEGYSLRMGLYELPD